MTISARPLSAAPHTNAVALADEVGIDIALHTGNTMRAAIPSRMGGANPEWLQAIVGAKMLGRKTGSGFYMYPPAEKGSRKAGGKSKEKQINAAAMALLQPYRTNELANLSAADCVERMLLRFIKECVQPQACGLGML